ncbi:MAG: hypothetical protein AYP45_14685 [Candidatus Brocadia carolinensis]|uniref:Uncharacterized protein n=1 Tax=Candidatus Brocadia carolinensis TaxID=1004156 RepID=A0A1V4AQN5_9BACT|nr:MAG: hypothetical protein AYP45_14685 [Candidatus Brocadia caroliniensis]
MLVQWYLTKSWEIDRNLVTILFFEKVGAKHLPLGYEHIYANYSKCFAPTLLSLEFFKKGNW